MPEGCGFKWMLSQYFDEYWGRWLADFVKTRGARLVFLTRTNVLRKYVSQAAKAVSEKTRVDAYYANETWYGGFNATTAAKDRLELKTGAALLRDLAKIDRDYEIIARLQADAETRGVPWFHATYEEPGQQVEARRHRRLRRARLGLPRAEAKVVHRCPPTSARRAATLPNA
ncbi:hypothetical protein JL721_6254 [Aureococcus anophagefferens]|nr:hypothetical protein JL721_6254 [Aureococcus anophagefferens]